MFMQSNQPFQQDSVLDGALLGGAIGAGAMYGVTKAAPKVQDWNKKDTRKNTAEYTKQLKLESARQEKLVHDTRSKLSTSTGGGGGSLLPATASQIANSDSPETRKAIQSAIKDMDPSKEMKKAQKDLKFNKTLDKWSGKAQGGSARTRATMYGGSILAGAFVGGMIDKGN